MNVFIYRHISYAVDILLFKVQRSSRSRDADLARDIITCWATNLQRSTWRPAARVETALVEVSCCLWVWPSHSKSYFMLYSIALQQGQRTAMIGITLRMAVRPAIDHGNRIAHNVWGPAKFAGTKLMRASWVFLGHPEFRKTYRCYSGPFPYCTHSTPFFLRTKHW